MSDTPSILCAICQSPIEAGESRSQCPECRAEYHTECWEENGGCAIYGCSQVPVVEQRHAIEVPGSYWGQENKPCPSCGRKILAAAMRCRFCGATFSSARPEDADEFQERSSQSERLPGVRRTVLVLFVLSVIPCLAPIGAIAGLAWFPSNRHDVQALPALYPALAKIGLAVAIGQSLTLILMVFLYRAVNNGG